MTVHDLLRFRISVLSAPKLVYRLRRPKDPTAYMLFESPETARRCGRFEADFLVRRHGKRQSLPEIFPEA